MRAFIDLIVFPIAPDLHWIRSATGFVAVALLAIGLVIWAIVDKNRRAPKD